MTSGWRLGTAVFVVALAAFVALLPLSNCVANVSAGKTTEAGASRCGFSKEKATAHSRRSVPYTRRALEYSDVIADDSRAAPGHLIENLFARYANPVMPGTGSLLAREMPSFCMRK